MRITTAPIVAGLGAWIAAALCMAGGACGEELPRYKLKLGQQLEYRCQSPPHEWDDGAGGKNSSTDVREWTVWVVRADADGWGLVFRQRFQRTSTLRGEERSYGFALDGHFDLTPAGRMTENSTIRPMGDPTTLFPPLPDDAKALKTSWTATTSVDDARRDLHAIPSDDKTSDGIWQFEESVHGALDDIYLSNQQRVYEFDRAQGLVRKVTTTSKNDWPKPNAYNSTTVTELVAVDELEPERLAAFVADAQRFFEVSEQYEGLWTDASQNHRRAKQLLDGGESLMRELDGKLTTPEVQAMLQQSLDNHPGRAKQVLDDVESMAPLLDKPSAEWHTTDLAGQPHALADYRGKVVVLDFWYRGCGWCVRAMPQMKQLADDFKEDRVVILGINSDQELGDAQFVVDKLHLNYETLKNDADEGNINRMYRVHMWPTLVFIDAQGIVRHYHSGYTAALREQVAKKIRELLAENQP